MRIFGAVVFVPTSMPTWHMMPKNDNSTTGLPNRRRQSPKPDALPLISSSLIGATKSSIVARMPTMKYIANSTRQLSPKVGIMAVAPHIAKYGARNDAMALMNCPKVSVLARFPPLMTAMTSGLSDVCMSALPMPSSENDSSMTVNDSPKRGKNNETMVTMRDNNTVFLRPILFISIPVGTEKMRNQKKTRDGKILATESESPKSALT